jgi:hypothetical protein
MSAVNVEAVLAGAPVDSSTVRAMAEELQELRASDARVAELHYPYPSADSPHAYCLSCLTGRIKPGSTFPEYVKWPCATGAARMGGA